MSSYFPLEDSIHYRLGTQVENVIETIANQYIGSNPANGFTFRATSTDSFNQLEDGRYDIDLNRKFPQQRLGEYGYAYCLVHCEQEIAMEWALSCYGPTRIYVNGELFYKSTAADDVNAANRRLLQPQLRKGWNSLFLKMIRTASGFGCILGSSNYKWFPLHCLSPFADRAGSGGWVYASTVQDVYPDTALPAWNAPGTMQPTNWLPELTQDLDDGCCDLGQLYGLQPGMSAYSWSTFDTCGGFGQQQCEIRGEAVAASVQIWVDEQLIYQSLEEPNGAAAALQASLSLAAGEHAILVRTVCGESSPWTVNLTVTVEGSEYKLNAPHPVKGAAGRWICLGPLQGSELRGITPAAVRTLQRLPVRSKGDDELESVYWRVTGMKNGYVRPYLENERFARWNYPLGVTLYGLLQTGRALNRADILRYVHGHIAACTSLYCYSLWDRQLYGAPAINHQLVELNMLDDCGSFGSAMLEACKDASDATSLDIAHIIARFIMEKQERRPDGAFYRRRLGEYQENTLWADDLYMSTPFLIRYYLNTGCIAAIDEAAQQFLLFKKYLYMPEQRIMSHVYDFKYETATYVPWGRGNGWVLFSLSELLEVLPEAHALRKPLLAFFNELAGGCLDLQGENGLWHQVLTDPTSYEEASCTAMFAYAFARGVRFGWLQQPAAYAEAARSAWEGLTKYAIDKEGNVYGVCRGSAYSFTPEYYCDELGWVINDTHGIGIVLLCGMEYGRMQQA